jgi:uncharacterized protein involved in outer membrane biogenesis
MAKSTLLRSISKALLGLFAVFVGLLLVLSLVKIPINLNDQKALFESLASKAIQRQVMIDGNIEVSTSLWPVFSIENVRISNPAGFISGDVVRMDNVQLQASVIPLLMRKIHVVDFTVKGLQLTLLEDNDGAVNWTSTQEAVADEPDRQVSNEEGQQAKLQLSSDTLVVEQIQLSDISVSYHKPDMAEAFNFVLNSATGSARVGEPFSMLLEGAIKDEPFETTLSAASLEELLTEDRSWMEIEMQIAGANLKLTGNIDLAATQRKSSLSAAVNGEQLDRFRHLLSIDLPPVPTYGASATLAVEKDRLALTDLNLTIGNSEFDGEINVVKSGAKPRMDIKLASPLLNLDDFDYEGWSPADKTMPASTEGTQDTAGKTESKEKPSSVAATDDAVRKQLEALFSPEVLQRFEASLDISAQQVLSGKDELGSGELLLQLENGRISIDPLQLNVPGGSMLVKVSLKPGHEASDATLRIKVDNFDVGVLARRSKPDTDLGGRINIDVDLKSSANHLRNILVHANGYVDFSIHPENMRAGVLDLWAVNLISSIAASADKEQSQIECMIGRWSMEDGEMKPDVVVLDTSRMRICMNGSVEFKEQTIDLKVRPTAKKPEYFSLATPLDVKGHFSDFELGIQTGGLVGTGLKFISSPLHVPVRRVFKKTLPADGNDICGLPLGPKRPTERAPGCPRF